MVVLLWFSVCPLLAAPAQNPEAPTEDGQTDIGSGPVPEHLSSPRSTMRSYMEAIHDVMVNQQTERIDDAMETMAFSDQVRAANGPELAKLLREIIDRVRFVIYDHIPDYDEGSAYVFHRGESGSVVIGRQEDGRWLFTLETIETLSELYLEMESKPVVSRVVANPRYVPGWQRIRSWIPGLLQKKGLLLEHWQWLGLLLLILVGLIIDRIVVLFLSRLLRKQLGRDSVDVFSNEQANLLRPLGLLGAALVWRAGLGLLGLPIGVQLVLGVAIKFVAIVSGIWAVYRLVDILSSYLDRRASRTENKFDDLLVPLIRKTLKVFVTVFGFVFVADMFQWNLGRVIAGLGIGGLAFAFAARDTVANLFGSVMILIDRPFQIGDWVVVGDIEGIVEEVGFRSTRVRTFYNSLVTMPNATVASAAVDNYGARVYRRTKTYLSLTYDTPPEKIEAFCEGIRELIRRHPHTRKDYYEVHLNQFASASLDVLLYCFHRVPNWSQELTERHRLYLDIIRLAGKIGVEFAFPTQTLHLYQEQQGESPVKAPGDQVAALEFGRVVAHELLKKSEESKEGD